MPQPYVPETRKGAYSIWNKVNASLNGKATWKLPAAPCMLFDNLNTAIGLANGTTGRLHSISYPQKKHTMK
jgi:hypothetical protein